MQESKERILCKTALDKTVIELDSIQFTPVCITCRQYV